jgi:hypothetical protein
MFFKRHPLGVQVSALRGASEYPYLRSTLTHLVTLELAISHENSQYFTHLNPAQNRRAKASS